MSLKLEYTNNGFPKIIFKDRYNKPCAIQKSSLATEDAIWFGIDNGSDMMHLTTDQVEQLLPILQNFVETGELTPYIEGAD